MSTLHARHRDDLPPPTVEEVADRTFAYVQLDGSWGLNNAGFLAGRGGVTVIDTAFTEARARALRRAIEGVTAAPIRTLVNTHHHGDHTHGNFVFSPEATIIAHERCRAEVLETGQSTEGLFPGVEWGAIEVEAPFVTFTDRLDIHVDDTLVELHFVGPAHTTNDVVAWLPGPRVLVTGDLVFNGGTPFCVMGSIEGSSRALERLRAFDASTLVPGHGPVCGPAVLDDMVAYLRFIQEVARRAVDAGVEPLDAARSTDLGRFAGWHDTERLVGNLHRAFAECRGQPLGGPIDLAAAIAGMIEYNGGLPLRCLA